MQKIVMVVSVLLLLMLAVPAAAEEGVELEIVNKTGKELSIELQVRTYGEQRTLTRVAAVGGTVHFSQEETAHKEGALLPSWEIIFNGGCQYKIVSKDGECSVLAGKWDCAMASRLGPRALKLVVGK